MARGEAGVKLWMVSIVVMLVAFVGLGIWYLAGPRGSINTGQSEENRDVSEHNVEQGVITGVYQSGEEIATLADYPTTLLVTDYDLLLDEDLIEGSVMNNTADPVVNVQVEFALLDAAGNRIETVRDTTSEIDAGGTWRFNIVSTASKEATEAQFLNVTGQPRGDGRAGTVEGGAIEQD